MTKYDPEKIFLVSIVFSMLALIGVIKLGLLSALLAGLLVYNIIVFGAEGLCQIGVSPSNKTAKIILSVTIFLFVLALFSIGGLSFALFISDGPESIVGLIKHIAKLLVSQSETMPGWLRQFIPSSIDGLQAELHEWLLSNARSLSALGRDAGLFLVHIVFGMIVGGMVALPAADKSTKAPLANALIDRIKFLSLAFRRIIFSQIRISALNTVLTAIFLYGFMPLMGFQLPLVKTMIVVTFIVGLLPIIGNIISNTVIVLISLGVSFSAAIAALIFLILIHKLEYFINARIIGSQISAHAWEILVAMLVMDAAFGLPGLVAAPIYYAYVKNELADKRLI